MKSLNLPKESQESLLNDANIFIKPIKFTDNFALVDNDRLLYYDGEVFPLDYLSKFAPYQIGDEVYIKKINIENGELICPICGFWCLGTGGQGCINKSDLYYNEIYFIIKNIKIVRVQKIPWNIKLNLLTGYNLENQKHNIFIEPLFKDWYNKQYGNYKDNPYVFLYEIERIDKWHHNKLTTNSK